MTEIARMTREAAFTELYHRNADRVYALCLRMSGDPSRASDLAQDVFIRIWRNFASLREGVDSGGWVWRVAVNVALNGLRSDRRLRAREIIAGGICHPENLSGFSTPLPIKRLALASAMKRLPPEARKVFLLHDVEGHSHGEVATLLGLASGTVRSQLHRARKLIRAELEA